MNDLQIVTVNNVNRWISGTYKGIGFSMKGDWLEIGKDFGIGNKGLELETRIRAEILERLGKGSARRKLTAMGV